MSEKLVGGNRSLHFVAKLHDILMANLQSEYRAADLAALSPSHGGILSALAAGAGLTMRELADATGRDKSTVTALCQKLEKLGLIARRGDPDDLRLARSALTDKGKAAAFKVRRAAQKQIIALSRALDEKERTQLESLLQKWLHGIAARD